MPEPAAHVTSNDDTPPGETAIKDKPGALTTGHAQRGSVAMRSLRTIGRLTLTGVIAAGALFASIAGQQVLSSRTAQDDGIEPAPRTSVNVSKIALQQRYTVERRFAGQFEARQETQLAFEEPGTIIEISVREGDRVEAGQTVARLDTRLLTAEQTRLRASLDAIDAQVELAERINARQESLRAAGHISEARLDESALTLARLEANRAEIDAALNAIAVRLSKAEITAPFDGRIGDRLVDVGTIATPGNPVLTFLEDGPVRFRVGIDPALARQIELGAPARIETASGSYDAVLARQTPELDPATRALVVYFETDTTAPARTTGEIVLPSEIETPGAWLPLSALRQGPRGTWTILTVNDPADGPASELDDAPTIEPRIGVEAIEVIHLSEGRVYARGTFTDGEMFLPDGTHRVVPGEPVALAGHESVDEEQAQ